MKRAVYHAELPNISTTQQSLLFVSDDINDNKTDTVTTTTTGHRHKSHTTPTTSTNNKTINRSAARRN